jgi:hypothetical protein
LQLLAMHRRPWGEQAPPTGPLDSATTPEHLHNSSPSTILTRPENLPAVEAFLEYSKTVITARHMSSRTSPVDHSSSFLPSKDPGGAPPESSHRSKQCRALKAKGCKVLLAHRIAWQTLNLRRTDITSPPLKAIFAGKRENVTSEASSSNTCVHVGDAQGSRASENVLLTLLRESYRWDLHFSVPGVTRK